MNTIDLSSLPSKEALKSEYKKRLDESNVPTRDTVLKVLNHYPEGISAACLILLFEKLGFNRRGMQNHIQESLSIGEVELNDRMELVVTGKTWVNGAWRNLDFNSTD
jgi:hypothetical protein